MKFENNMLNILMDLANSKEVSLKSVAKMAGIHVANIYRWKDGTYTPGMKIFRNIGNVMGLELVWVSKEYVDIVSEKYCNIDRETIIRNIKQAEIEQLKARIKELEEES